MIPLDLSLFGTDPWWLVVIKVLVLFVVLLVWTIFNVWYERRLVGKMQHRLGPIMNGPFGLGQALADGAKLIAKEDFRPKNADKFVFNLAPVLTGVAAFTCWTVIPFSGELELFGVTTRLQVADLPVSAIFILASASIGIYGIVLAGWAGNSTYSFLGSMRSTAQMISFVAERRPRRVALITECSMSDNIAAANPDLDLIRPCNLCPHMKRNTLGAIRRALETMTNEVTIDPAVAARARAAVDRMLEVR